MDIKKDLIRVIELNESVLDLDKDIKDIHLNIICEIRARLLDALKKANQFYDHNLELLATVTQLKKENESAQASYGEKLQILAGRIATLIDIVQKQQNELEAQNKILRLRGIWSNLLKTTNLPQLSSYEDECSTVITWLSLQCARDAYRVSNTDHHHHSHNHQQRHLNHQPPCKEHSQQWNYLDINLLLEKMQTLYNESEEKSWKLSQENSDLRRLLNENGAKHHKLLQELEEQRTLSRRIEMELEDWQSRARQCHSDQKDCQCHLQKHVIIIQKIEKELAEQKMATLLWRNKCHEILDAVDLANSIPTYEFNSFQTLSRDQNLQKTKSTRQSIPYNTTTCSNPLDDHYQHSSPTIEAVNTENDEYSDRLLPSRGQEPAVPLTPYKSEHEPHYLPENVLQLNLYSSSTSTTFSPNQPSPQDKERAPHRHSASSTKFNSHPNNLVEGVFQLDQVERHNDNEDNSRTEQKEQSPRRRLISPPPQIYPREMTNNMRRGDMTHMKKDASPGSQLPMKGQPTKHSRSLSENIPERRLFHDQIERNEKISPLKQWDPYFIHSHSNRNNTNTKSNNSNHHSSFSSPSVYDIAIENTKQMAQQQPPQQKKLKPISPIYNKKNHSLVSNSRVGTSVDGTGEPEVPSVPSREDCNLGQEFLNSKTKKLVQINQNKKDETMLSWNINDEILEVS